MSESAQKNLVSTASASASIVSPLDERYASVMRPLAAHTSEYGLLKYRVAVEIEWLIFMAARPEITHVAALSPDQISTLRSWVTNFDETESAKIKAHEVKIQHDVKAVEYYLREKLNSLMAKHTGQPIEQIEKDTDRDRWMSAEDAKAYGLVDNIVANRTEVGDLPKVAAAVTG